VQKATNSPNINIVVSDPQFKAEFIDKLNRVAISGKTGEVLTVQQFTLFIYGDQFQQNLLGTVRVEVYAREVIYTRVRMEHTSSHTLSLPVTTSRRVRLHSNKSDVIRQSKTERNKEKHTIAGSTTHFNVELTVTDRRQLASPTLVNCVDAKTEELVYSWLFIIEAL
jgi:hypothetical protein